MLRHVHAMHAINAIDHSVKDFVTSHRGEAAAGRTFVDRRTDPLAVDEGTRPEGIDAS